MTLDFIGKLAWPVVIGAVLYTIRKPALDLLRGSERVHIDTGVGSIEVTRSFDRRESEQYAQPVADAVGITNNPSHVVRDNDTAAATESAGIGVPSPDHGTAHDGGASSTIYAESTADGTITTYTERLIDINPNMAMLHGFIQFEERARALWRDFTDQPTPSHLGLRDIIRAVEPRTRDLLRYLSEVRNGIAHGASRDYSSDEATDYLRQLDIAARALEQAHTWLTTH